MAKMGRETAKQIIDEVKAALTPICEKHNVKLAKNNARYDDVMIRLTLEMECLGDSGENVAERAIWDATCVYFSLSAGDYGKVIPSMGGGRDYKLVAIEPKRPRYPFVGEEVGTGRRYKLTADSVKWGLDQVKAGK